MIKKSTKLTSKRLSGFDLERFAQDLPWVEDTKTWNKISKVWLSFRKEWSRIETQLERQVFKLKIGDELQPGIRPEHFHMRNTLERLERFGDLWLPVLESGVDLDQCVKNF